MTRKHFKALATILSENNCDVNLLKDIMLFCKSHNSNFDSVRFVEASGFTVNQSGNFVRHPDLLNEKTTKLTLSGHTVKLPLNN